MGCWKVMDLRLRLWLPWTVLLIGLLLTYGYYQLLDSDNCANLLLGCTISSFALPKYDSDSSYGSTASTPPPPPYKPLYNDTRRIAVCLVGGARIFELTGRTLRKNLLDPYPNTDVFLQSPLDSDSHKLSLLTGSRNLRVVKIFTPTTITETDVTKEVITAWGSPHGLQGLLQYFNLVEGCYGLVKQYEVRHQFKYDWIIRTRLDGYWSSPIQNIAELDPMYYYVAAGSDFQGLNDRFGMGSSHTSRAANARLSLLPLMYQSGLRGMNSERAYKAQLQVLGVAYTRIQGLLTGCSGEALRRPWLKRENALVPFCIMTLRQMQYPPPPFGLLLLSMASQGPMSGTYCRPCDKESNATMSKFVVDQCMRNWDWPGVSGNDVTVCDGREPWASDWRGLAASMYQLHSDDPQPIRQFDKRGFEDCVREMREFQAGWDVWNSPPVESICNHAMRK